MEKTEYIAPRGMKTPYGIELPKGLVSNYCQVLINMFYKILPMKENGEETIQKYMESLMFELVGAKGVMVALRYDSLYLSLIAILQGLIDQPDCEVAVTKREVFTAISICKKLQDRYGFREIRF